MKFSSLRKSARLKILVLFGSIPLYGQERGNIEVLRTLQESAGAEVLFVTHSRWGHLAVQPELDRLGIPWTTACYAERFEKGMGIRRWGRNIQDLLIGSAQLARIARKFRPTHIHVGNPSFFLNFLPWLLLSRCPIIYRVGDKPSLHNVFYLTLWKLFIIPMTSCFVANSSYIRNSLLTAGVPAGKIRTIYNRPPFRDIKYGTAQDLIKKEGMLILYVGQICSHHKGVDILINAAVQILRDRPDVRLWLAGDYSWQKPLTEEFMYKVNKSGLKEQIRFLGYRHDIVELFTQCSFHVCPSTCEEASANVVFEAKQAARPSVIFPSGGLPELIRHEIDGYCCQERNVDSLIKAIQYYLHNPEKCVTHGKAARQSLDDVFQVKKFPKKWLEVYLNAL
ncbi:MAG: glycosyltransferase family 1 protein [Candidatus Electrothrix sp. AUS1_2]|nr:glycosyltransferase family 1 protein [Candidatus Electrothrix sp. AUS1_2]